MTRSVKKRLGLMLCLIVMVFTVSGCGHKGRSNNDTIKIGVCVYDQYDTFLTQLINSFDAEVENDVLVEYVYASQNQSTQNDQVQSMIEKGVDVLCVNLVDRTAPTTIIDLARKNDVPIIFFNRELVEEDLMQWSKLYYVGADAYESGTLQGEIAAKECKKNMDKIDANGDGVIQYVVLEGEAGHQDSIVRTEYSVNTMIEKGVSVEKVGYAIANWNRSQAQTKMAQLIEKNGNEIELVLANNDDMALGAVDAYGAAGYPAERRPAIFGIDGTDIGLNAVADGTILGTVYNDKEGQAKAMYGIAVALAKGESVDGFGLTDGKYIRLPYTIVDSSNVDEFLK
ncbi:MAG: galactose ABC transporter substrate-binding protein [Butyrivibrio sp.]|nr:galactose ABC transporter substrate-binding protein [Butyrivibrio sp.]